MHRHRVESEALGHGGILLSKEDARHLVTVLRLREGAEVECFDGSGKTRLYAMGRLAGGQLELTALAPLREAPPGKTAVQIYACVTKGDRWLWTLEKATELGAARIVPVISERTIVRIGEREAEAKRRRWQRIAEEAARQCGTAWEPRVARPATLREAAAESAGATTLVAALTPEAKPLKSVMLQMNAAPWPKTLAWWSGPEGDFTEEELALLLAGGAVPVNLGENVLRAETAAIYGLAVINCFTQEGNASA